ncbi:hypothetical protein [Blastopirellula retiformator]|uniref:Uncharacterized protein n=1 Tax=Blastopirellula retiformator TaxID=2527970 RepID=A0A5C5VKH0_9BACT|nr:hypothetical protein [Blastopirellula retiformator]TWT38561.1 hypothetical protein Enr8_02540 [Blastopirellula retiformator]
MKKSTLYFWIFGGVSLLVVLLLIWIVAGPSGPILVSKQTTYLTSPLRSDGLVDYSQAIIDMQGQDVSPEENAAIPFLEATWPCDIPPEQQALVCDALQMPLPPVDGMLSMYNDQLSAQVGRQLGQLAPQPGTAPAEPLDTSEVFEIMAQVTQVPWTRGQVPDLADWFEAQQPHFDKLQEMNERPKYYLPSPTLLANKNEFLFAALLPTVQHQRDVARALMARAMLAIGEQRPQDAWQDIKTCLRLSGCCSKPSFLIEALVCDAIRGIALNALAQLLASGQCDAALLAEIEAYLAALPPFDEMAPSINTLERLGGLDAALAFCTKKAGANEMLGGSGAAVGAFSYAPFDRNAMLMRLNVWYDRIAATTEIDDLEQREAALEQLELDLSAEVEGATSPGNIAGAIFNQRARGEMVAQVLAGLILPTVTQAVYAEERLNLQLQLARVAVALERYKLENGDYPEALAALEKRIDLALLKDPYAPAQLRYAKRPPGFLLYSVGRDRIDDGGASQDGEIVGGEWIAAATPLRPQNWDMVIRFPLPKKSIEDFLPWNLDQVGDSLPTDPVEEEPAEESKESGETETPPLAEPAPAETTDQ